MAGATEDTSDYPRDRYGRALVRLDPDAKLTGCTRPTTIAKALDDAEGLTRWKVRMTAQGLATRSDLLALVAATPAEDRRKLDELCDAAKEAAAGSSGANTGSALHLFTADLDRGKKVSAPAPLDAALDLYASTLAGAGVRVVPQMIERPVVLTGQAEPIAGTLDRIVEVRDELYVADLKSGRTLDYSWLSIAVQLAIYARAQHFYDPADETLTSKPEVCTDRALVIHLRHDPPSCSLHWVRIGEGAGWSLTKLALAVRAARRRHDLREDFTAAELDVDAMRAAWLRRRVETIRDQHPIVLGDLAAMWPAGVPTFKADHAHDADELGRIAAVLDRVEAAHRLPFPDPDPDVVRQHQHQHDQIGALIA